MAEIRSLSKLELPKVQELAHLIWPIAYKEILSQEQLDYMLNWMYSIDSLEQQLLDGHQYFGIYDQNEMLGFLDIQLNHPFDKEMKVNKIYVLTNQQGKQLGYQLMIHAIDFAKMHNMKSISLQVNRHNKAFEFYKKIGFIIREEKDFAIGNGYYMNDYMMELNLLLFV
jgi:ribosomal protein S18 acetylase RimI-like enzyme